METYSRPLRINVTRANIDEPNNKGITPARFLRPTKKHQRGPPFQQPQHPNLEQPPHSHKKTHGRFPDPSPHSTLHRHHLCTAPAHRHNHTRMHPGLTHIRHSMPAQDGSLNGLHFTPEFATWFYNTSTPTLFLQSRPYLPTHAHPRISCSPLHLSIPHRR
jgi:hypothetical protein